MKKQHLEKFLANHSHFHSHALLHFPPEDATSVVAPLNFFETLFLFDHATVLISRLMLGTGGKKKAQICESLEISVCRKSINANHRKAIFIRSF